MDRDRPGAPGSDFTVRLAWPAAGAAAEAPPVPPSDPPSSDTPSAPPAPPRVPKVGAPTPPRTPRPESRPAATKVRPSTAEVVRPPRPASSAIEVLAPTSDARMGRVFVEAFDRLADRLLERLRILRQDVDADLASVRSDLAGLRQSVDDLGDRAQMRQVRQSLDELRADVAGLRRAVLEWPELEQVANDVASVRSDLTYLFDTLGEGSGDAPSALLSELHAVVDKLDDRAESAALDQPQLAVLAPLMEEVAAMREELTSVRRRLVLRASPIDDEQLEQIVSAVAARVVEELAGDGRRSKRR